MPEWLAPVLFAVGWAGTVVGAFGFGREYQKHVVRRALSRQVEIEARLVGEDPKNLPATEERAVVHRPVIESSHSWSEGNNGDF